MKNWSRVPNGRLTPRWTGRLIVGRNVTSTLTSRKHNTSPFYCQELWPVDHRGGGRHWKLWQYSILGIEGTSREQARSRSLAIATLWIRICFPSFNGRGLLAQCSRFLLRPLITQWFPVSHHSEHTSHWILLAEAISLAYSQVTLQASLLKPLALFGAYSHYTTIAKR
jgi:hypothetical protein